jgi:hypothetical protein
LHRREYRWHLQHLSLWPAIPGTRTASADF